MWWQDGVAEAQESNDIAVGLICIAVGAMGEEEMEKEEQEEQ